MAPTPEMAHVKIEMGLIGFIKDVVISPQLKPILGNGMAKTQQPNQQRPMCIIPIMNTIFSLMEDLVKHFHLLKTIRIGILTTQEA